MIDVMTLTMIAGAAGLAYIRMNRLAALMDVDWHPGPRLVWHRQKKAMRAIGYFLLSIGLFLVTHDAWSSATAPIAIGISTITMPWFFSGDLWMTRRHDHDQPIGPELPRGQYSNPLGPELPSPDLRTREAVERWLEES